MTERRLSLPQAGYEVLNIGFHAAHQSFIVFTVVGWVFCETRLLHLAIVGLVGLSWLGLGAFFGFGYCLLTDIHWKLKERMGEERPTGGYIKHLADRMTGRDFDAKFLDTITYVTCAVCVALSILLTVTLGTC